ncbi:MAG: phenylacetate--CoA ligase family protein [Candidatus Pacebacteria bacterium]|nr:phenylacetate--CoA ligase family protein [Candidatus Paceibacterota bacterium]
MFYLTASADIAFRLPELIATLVSQRTPVILYGYTSWIIEMAKQVRRGVTVPPVYALVATGEGISATDRKMIETVFDAPFYTTYATRELGWLGFECEERRMHINEEWAFVEILDDHDAPVTPGHMGRIIVTTFDNSVMPFIRYAIGDRGSIDTESCPCGRTLRTITFSGRQSDRIELEDGQSFSLLDISPLFDSYWDAVHQYQMIQTAPLAFTIRIVPGPEFESRLDALHQRMVRAMHPRVHISWERVDTIAPAKSGKAVYYLRTY